GAGAVAETYGFLLDGFQHVFSLVTALFFVWSKSPVFAGIFVLFVFGESLLSLWQARRLRVRREEFDKARNQLTAETDDILAKREIILAWDQQTRYAAQLSTHTRHYAEIERDLDVKQSQFDAITRWTFDVGRVVVLILAIVITMRQKLDGIGDAYFLIS